MVVGQLAVILCLTLLTLCVYTRPIPEEGLKLKMSKIFTIIMSLPEVSTGLNTFAYTDEFNLLSRCNCLIQGCRHKKWQGWEEPRPLLINI